MDYNTIKSIEDEYLNRRDWEVLENANMNVSFSGFLDFILDKTLKREEVLKEFLPLDAVKAHFEGWIHVHKLPYSLWIPYCIGWNVHKILRTGLDTPSIKCGPPKHLSSALSQVVDFLYISQQEWTGAQAFTALDLYMAPFLAFDKLGEEDVKQSLQSMLYQLNVPARLGLQSPFTNITLMLDLNPDILHEKAFVGGRVVGELGDYLSQALDFVKILLKLYMEGDFLGQPFTFPIPTLILNKNFDWNGRRWGELTDLIFEAVAKKGVMYFLNGYVSGVDSLYAMCCRLTIDLSKIEFRLSGGSFKSSLKNVRGVWAIPDGTGSIGIITLNLPRLAAFSKGDMNKFEELLVKYLEIARKTLKILRNRYIKHLSNGLMPITLKYLGTLQYHFNTIGLLGLPEAAANLMRNPKLWFEGTWRELKEAVKIEKEIVSTVRKITEAFEEEDDMLYNVEEPPGESTSYRFALSDSRLLREREDILIPSEEGTPFYSNSIVPYYAPIPIFKRILLESEVQQEFTGGVMMHLFLAQQPDIKALKNLVRRIVENTKIVYFSITPTITVCRKCRYVVTGYYDKCPKCGSEDLEHWSRIVGYYRPVSNWNIGKKAEFKSRIQYSSSFYPRY